MTRNLFFLSLLFVLASCDSTLVKSEYLTTSNGYWDKDSVMKFNFSELDTIQKYNVYINVRNDESFPYKNLFLISEMTFPTGKTVTDTLEYEMAMADGTWLGKGYSSIKENKLWYKENIVFPTSGVYTIQISHAMRKIGSVNGIVNLEGITDVGFEIVKSN